MTDRNCNCEPDDDECFRRCHEEMERRDVGCEYCIRVPWNELRKMGTPVRIGWLGAYVLYFVGAGGAWHFATVLDGHENDPEPHLSSPGDGAGYGDYLGSWVPEGADDAASTSTTTTAAPDPPAYASAPLDV